MVRPSNLIIYENPKILDAGCSRNGFVIDFYIKINTSWLFLRLTIMRDNLLKCSHSLTFSSSVLAMLCSSVLLLPEMDNTVSSAKSVGISFVDGKAFI